MSAVISRINQLEQLDASLQKRQHVEISQAIQRIDPIDVRVLCEKMQVSCWKETSLVMRMLLVSDQLQKVIRSHIASLKEVRQENPIIIHPLKLVLDFMPPAMQRQVAFAMPKQALAVFRHFPQVKRDQAQRQRITNRYVNYVAPLQKIASTAGFGMTHASLCVLAQEMHIRGEAIIPPGVVHLHPTKGLRPSEYLSGITDKELLKHLPKGSAPQAIRDYLRERAVRSDEILRNQFSSYSKMSELDRSAYCSLAPAIPLFAAFFPLIDFFENHGNRPITAADTTLNIKWIGKQPTDIVAAFEQQCVELTLAPQEYEDIPYTSTQEIHALYGCLWEVCGRPAGDPDFGRHALYHTDGQSSTDQQKADAFYLWCVRALDQLDRLINCSS